jgi:integrase
MSSKARGYGEGSIARRKDGRFEVRLSLGIDPVTGKRLRRFVYTRSQREAVRVLHEERGKLKQGQIGPRAALTTRAFLDQWLASVLQSRRRGTYTNLEAKVRIYINPMIGDVPLRALTRMHIDQVLDAARPKLALSTLALLRVCLGTALNTAVTWELIDKNPVTLTEAPRVPRREQHFLDVAGAQRLLTIIQQSEYSPIYLMALTTGMRVGEILGLRWQDIDLDHRQLTVAHAVARIDGELHLLEPKTQSSRRSITLSQVSVAALRAHRVGQTLAFLDGSGLVFPGPTGTPIDSSSVRRSFRQLLRRNHLPAIRVHDLRHSWASIQLAMGTPAKVVSEQLGHASISVTLDTYSHVVPAMMQQAADAMDRALATTR